MSAGSPDCLETASDSPVRMDSFTESPSARTSALSAGTLSPASSRMQSPQTSSRAGMVCHFPSRQTVAVGAVRLRRDSSVCSVRYSCKKPRMALSRTMRMMVTASVISPRKADTPVAASRISTITSRNCPRNIRRGWSFAAAASSFSPSCFRRSRAALVVRPFIGFLLSRICFCVFAYVYAEKPKSMTTVEIFLAESQENA